MNVVQSRRRSRTGAGGRRSAGRGAAPATRREERARREVKPAQERRRDILDGALRLFARQGFNDTAVGDIAARALTAGVELGMIHTSDPEMTSYLFEAALAYNLHMHIAYGDPPDIDRFISAAKEMVHKTLALPREMQPTRTRAATAGARRR